MASSTQRAVSKALTEQRQQQLEVGACSSFLAIGSIHQNFQNDVERVWSCSQDVRNFQVRTTDGKRRIQPIFLGSTVDDEPVPAPSAPAMASTSKSQ